MPRLRRLFLLAQHELPRRQRQHPDLPHPRPQSCGGGPTLFSYNKLTDEVTKVGPLFDSSSPVRRATGEGWYWSGKQASKLYVVSGAALYRYDVNTKQLDLVFDATAQFGSNRAIWQTHTSDDDAVHSATLRDSTTWDRLGCLVYSESTKQFSYFPKTGAFDECQVDKSASNAGTSRLDAFLVTVPVQLLGVSSGGGAGDATAPTVSITAPGAGSTVSGSVTVSASASDNVGVAGVQFKLAGANLGAELTAAPFSMSWNTAGAANGAHTLTATARDSAGNTKTSAGVSITVANTTGGGGPSRTTSTVRNPRYSETAGRRSRGIFWSPTRS